MSLFRSLLKLLTLIALLAAIALQPVSVAVSSMLGQRHVHREPVASAKIWLRLAGNWHGAAHAARSEAASTVGHTHLHSLGLRHHHDIDDRSVVALEPPTSADGSPADTSPSPAASFAFVVDCGGRTAVCGDDLRRRLATARVAADRQSASTAHRAPTQSYRLMPSGRAGFSAANGSQPLASISA